MNEQQILNKIEEISCSAGVIVKQTLVTLVPRQGANECDRYLAIMLMQALETYCGWRYNYYDGYAVKRTLEDEQWTI